MIKAPPFFTFLSLEKFDFRFSEIGEMKNFLWTNSNRIFSCLQRSYKGVFRHNWEFSFVFEYLPKKKTAATVVFVSILLSQQFCLIYNENEEF